jgi:hypothetical protein
MIRLNRPVYRDMGLALALLIGRCRRFLSTERPFNVKFALVVRPMVLGRLLGVLVAAVIVVQRGLALTSLRDHVILILRNVRPAINS